MYRRLLFIVVCWLLIFLFRVHARENCALIIGISSYPDFPAGEKLKYGDKDAAAFAAFLQTPAGGGLSQDDIRLIRNEKANRNGILDGIKWLNNRANGEQRIFVFFSGHALPDDDGQVYLIPYGVGKENPDYGIHIDEFFRRIRALRAKYSFLFLDACHSSAALNPSGAKGEASVGTVIREAWRTESESHKGSLALAFFSASSNQKSFEHEKAGGGHGIFTYFALEGLKGQADGSRDGQKNGIVTTGELYAYLEKEVQNISARYIGSTQTPTRSPEWDPNVSLAEALIQQPSLGSSSEVSPLVTKTQSDDEARLLELAALCEGKYYLYEPDEGQKNWFSGGVSVIFDRRLKRLRIRSEPPLNGQSDVSIDAQLDVERAPKRAEDWNDWNASNPYLSQDTVWGLSVGSGFLPDSSNGKAVYYGVPAKLQGKSKEILTAVTMGSSDTDAETPATIRGKRYLRISYSTGPGSLSDKDESFELLFFRR